MNRKERREKVKEINLLDEAVGIIRQYFPQLLDMFQELTDARNQSYVTYEMKVIFMVRLMALMCEIKSMNGISSEFNTDEAIQNIAQICGTELDEIPHHDTINNVLETIEISELEQIIKYIITRLIRSKMLDKFKIRDKYYLVVVDGTGLAASRVKYNDNCLTKKKTNKYGEEYIEYSTYVLEAKLVMGNMVFSIGTEFIENTDEKESKQDCEIKAFKRLAEKIKKEYPRLKILISGDALYASKSVIDICNEYGWKYIIRLKEGAIPTLYEEFETVVKRENETQKENYECATNLDYRESKINVVRYTEMKKNIATEFVYMTDLPITEKTIVNTVAVGRMRWKIENEGFNIQKNGTFDIGHLYSRNQIAIKVHYLLIQIAHAIRQLLENGDITVKELKCKIKEISHILKNTLISRTLNLVAHSKMQLRFDE